METTILKCFNCNGPYTIEVDGKKRQNSLKLPLLLKCGHCYCSCCLTILAKQLQSAVIPCPECRVQTPITAGIAIRSQLPLSIYTVGLISANQLGLNRPHPFNNVSIDDEVQITETVTDKVIVRCEECDIKVAEVKCDKCDCVYCNSCFEVIHSSSKTLRLHKKVAIGTEQDTTSSNYPVEEVETKEILMRETLNKAQTNIVMLKKMAATVTVNETRMVENSNKSMESCLKYITNIHRQIEASFAEVEFDYYQKRHDIINNNRLLTNEIGKKEKELNKLIIIMNNSLKNKQLLLQNTDTVIMDINSIDEGISSLKKECITMNNIRIVINPSSIDTDLSKISTVETDQIQLPIIFEEPSTPTKQIQYTHSPMSQSPAPNRLSSGYKNSYRSRSRSSSRSRDNSLSRGNSPSEHGRVNTEDAIPCKVCFVESPSEFWIQYENELIKLDTVNKFVDKFCQTNQQQAILKKGVTCGSRTREGVWRRAIIERIDWNSPVCVFVLLIDYGISEMVSMESVCIIPEQYLELPPFAHKCTLGGIQPSSNYISVVASDWTQNTISYFRSITINQSKLKMKILSKQWSHESLCNILTIDLFLPAGNTGGVSVANELLLQGKAQKIKEKPLNASDLPIGPVPPVGTTIKVDMVTAQSPSDFYVLSANDNSILDHISSLISKHLSSGGVTAILLTRLVPGALVLAPFDNEYYRAKIMDIDNTTESVLVRYLDHGNTCRVGVSELFEMNKKLVRIPPACYHCCLTHNGVSHDKWSEEVCDTFYNITNGKRLLMVTKGSITTNGIIPVQLVFIDDRQDVWDLLVPKPLPSATPTLLSNKSTTPTSSFKKSISSPKDSSTLTIPNRVAAPISINKAPPTIKTLPPINYKGHVIVKHVQTPLQFHIVLKEKLQIFEKMESCPPATTLTPFIPEPGKYCHALFDMKYHRGLVKSIIDSMTCQVYYIDYGNEEIVPFTDLLPLPNELSNEEPLAIPCRLFGVDHNCQFDYSTNLEFYNLVYEKDIIAVVKEVHIDPPLLIISLTCNTVPGIGTVDVLDTLKQKQIIPPSLLVFDPLSSQSSSQSTEEVVSVVNIPSVTIRLNIFNNESSDTTMVSCPTYLPPVVPSCPFKILVTYVDHEGIVYGQPVVYTHLFEEVDESVAAVNTYRPIASINTVSTGQGCVARFTEDGQWYRATIKNIIDTECAEVNFIDFGNSGTVHSHDIINELAAKSVPQLSLEFSKYSYIGKKSLILLLDKELTVQQHDDDDTRMDYNGEELHLALYKLVPLPPSSPSSLYSSS